MATTTTTAMATAMLTEVDTEKKNTQQIRRFDMDVNTTAECFGIAVELLVL